MNDRSRIPRPTVKRLSLYLRELETLAATNQLTLNSRQLGAKLGLTDAQVRKDLAYFGQFGHPGIGYRVPELINKLRRILGTDKSWKACIVGAGNIGRALLPYSRFIRKGFEIVAVFDANAKIVGRTVGDHTVLPMSKLARTVSSQGVLLGIVAVPVDAAQQVADQLVAAGVIGILNFAPIRLEVDDAVSVVDVDLSLALEQLAFEASLSRVGQIEQR